MHCGFCYDAFVVEEIPKLIHFGQSADEVDRRSPASVHPLLGCFAFHRDLCLVVRCLVMTNRYGEC